MRCKTLGFREERFQVAFYTNAWNLILAEQKLLQPGAKQIYFVHNTFMNWFGTITIAFTDIKPNFSLDISVFRRLSYFVFFAIHLHLSDRLLLWSLAYFSKQLCSEWLICPVCILIISSVCNIFCEDVAVFQLRALRLHQVFLKTVFFILCLISPVLLILWAKEAWNLLFWNGVCLKCQKKNI